MVEEGDEGLVGISYLPVFPSGRVGRYDKRDFTVGSDEDEICV